MPAWKRTTNKGKFIELACKKQFQKKGEPKRKLSHMPLNEKEANGPKKKRKIKFLKKSLGKMNLCKEYVCNFCVLCTKYAWV